VALVVGNPSTEGFAAAFPGKGGAGDPLPLPGAESEAYAVSRILRGAGYHLVESIGQDQRAVDIINRLFQRPYRILHIAAHGEFEARGPDGKPRGGVVLSDGLMLTAAEIGQMEVVPDLVFLNCCHLGTIDDKPVTRGVEYNKLASSVARALIEMGVRAVVAAGWAVDDRAGQHFAEVFYRGFIEEGKPFGKAIHEARRDTHGAFGSTNTWGAFQAYGDPGFLIDPTRAREGGGGEAGKFAAPPELLDQLDQLRERLKRPGGRKSETTLRALQREIGALLARGPKSWAARGDVQYAIGRVYADIGDEGFALACDYYLKAVERENDAGRVPIKAIEQLANMETRGATPPGDASAVERALDRLHRLVQAVASVPNDDSSWTPERCALVGSACKRLAAKMAEKVAAAPEERQRLVRNALEKARDAYRGGVGKPKTPEFNPYCALNQLMLDALLGDPCDNRLMQEVLDAARSSYRQTHDYWSAMMPADVRLTEAIFDGTLAGGPPAQDVIDLVVEGYRLARGAVLEDAKSWDSVANQIRVLGGLADGLDRKGLADNLHRIAATLQPADSEPPPGPEEPGNPAARVVPTQAGPNEPPTAPRRDDADPPADSAPRKKPGKGAGASGKKKREA
ncbi:MAG: CHAT domain-containing protein, partial [Rhodocyclaceae bacterium]